MDPQPKDTRRTPATFPSSQNSPHKEIHPNQLFCPSCPFRAQDWTEFKAHELARSLTQSVSTGPCNWNQEFANIKAPPLKSTCQNSPGNCENSKRTLHAATEDNQILQGASTKTFTIKSHLRRHQKKSCREGTVEFLKEKEKTFEGHESLHHCTICSYRSKRKSDLTKHFKCHSEHKPFHCPIEGCKYRAKWRQNVRIHSRFVHNFELPRKRLPNKENFGPAMECQIEIEEVDTNNSSIAFACMWCDFIGDSQLSALEHARQHAAVQMPLDLIH